MSGNKNSQPKDRSSLIILLLLIGAGALFFKYLGDEPVTSTARGVASPHAAHKQNPEFEKSVNRHLMMTNDKVELAQQRMAVDNNRLTKDFHETSAQKVYEQPQGGVDLTGEGYAANVAEDLGRGERKSTMKSPHDVIQAELFNAQQDQEYSEAYRQEYARQFVENARRGGYKVQLDEDFKVISVTPLRKPSQNSDVLGVNSAGKPLQ